MTTFASFTVTDTLWLLRLQRRSQRSGLAKECTDDYDAEFYFYGSRRFLNTILLGIFAEKDVNGISGLIEGDVHQFGVQLFGTLLASAYAFVITMLILKVVNKFLPVRVTPEEERIGPNASLHHKEAYHL